MNISNFKLCVGIPLTFPFVPARFFYSFSHMDKGSYTMIDANNGPIDALRNNLVERAFIEGATHLIMVDTDMDYAPNTIPSLLSHNLPVVGALSYRRYPPFDPIMLRGEAGDYESIDEWEEGELVEVDATGAGCLLFNMDVFKKMPAPWFKTRHLKGGGVLGEDIGFCSDLRKAGYKIFVDTTVPSGHITSMVINDQTYRLYKHMKTLQQQKALGQALESGEPEGP